jgi:hypothetical protein
LRRCFAPAKRVGQLEADFEDTMTPNAVFALLGMSLPMALIMAQNSGGPNLRAVSAGRCSATPATAPAPTPGGTAGRTGPPLQAPSGSISVVPGAVQAAVNSHAANSSFLLSPGTYTDGPIVPKNGDSFYGQGQVTWDGLGTKQQAFISAGTNHVTVSGIRFIHFNPPNHGTGIFNLNNGESDFFVEGCEIAYNSGTPVYVGNGTRIANNSIHDNYWMGIAGYQVGHVTIDHNEIYNNYLAKLSPDSTSGDASGLKFFQTNNVSVTDNYIHDNYGVGVWFDTDNTGTLIDGNVIANNTYRGVMDEVSYEATISNNTIIGNGELSGWIAGAGILIAVTANLEICNNVIKDNYQGITGFQQNRGAGPQGTYATSHTSIHDNYITMSQGLTGLTSGPERDPTNRFYNNHYCLKNGAGFIWGNKTNEKGWQAAGQDTSGTFDCGF